MNSYYTALADHERLRDRREYSKGLIEKIRAALAARPACTKPELCVYAAGSLARHETGRASVVPQSEIARA